MTPSGTYYYPPSAGTGGFLFTNPPFKMTDQPIAPGLPGLSEEEFLKMPAVDDLGFTNEFALKKFFGLTQSAYQRGADDQLEACAEWLRTRGWSKLAAHLRDAMRPKPPSPREQALAILDDCNLDAAQKSTIREALEALPE